MSYVRNAWYVASWEQDLKVDKPFAVTVLGEPIVLWRSQVGKIAALEDRCVHRLAPLSLGRCEGEKIRCMYHGFVYNSSGVVTEIPGQDLIPPHAKVRVYPVTEKHSWIWVWMGDPALADEVLIPPAVGFDNPEWLLGRGVLEYQAEGRLICDNLLDFSHLSYVHRESFGATENWAHSRPKVTALERGVRVERWLLSQPAPNGGPKGGELQDQWVTYDFLIPGILLMTGGNYREGAAKSFEMGPPDLSKAESGVTFTSQAVTPIGPGRAHYFFSWGPHVRCGDVALRDALMVMAMKAFEEDRAMIEAQQRVINSTASPRILPTSADKAITLFNMIVDRLAREP